MNNKVFISCAVTGSGDTAKKHPDLPKICLTPATIEVIDKSGNIKGYITDKELSKALSKNHSNGRAKP